ncbi:MAG: ribosome small subunit-dependent GTPase A [Gemmatimonadetes bacterium]|nr:ribosome small subunit-dependent GTPase A [Gemmatimonadota bacterium]
MHDVLTTWGWDAGWEVLLAAHQLGLHHQAARVTAQERDRWSIQLADGPVEARLVGTHDGPLPVTGDWVVVEPGPLPTDPWTLRDVLSRRTAISRGSAGEGGGEQLLAANVDVIWIVQPLDVPINPRSIERYLAVAWESGAVPVIVLTKADLVTDLALARAEVATVALGVDVHVVRVDDDASLAALRATLRPGRTVALLGPSGAGKSTLVNTLAGAHQLETGEVRAFDRKGRHTTTRRELYQIAGGALLMDTPGLRELRIWTLDEGLAGAFPEIDELAATCRFRDCRHDAEPGCAVVAAVEAGQLAADRLASYRKLQAEAAWIDRKHDARARAAAVSQHKTALKTMKHHPKYRPEDR